MLASGVSKLSYSIAIASGFAASVSILVVDVVASVSFLIIEDSVTVHVIIQSITNSVAVHVIRDVIDI